MRSFVFTALLGLLAAAVCGIVGWQWRDGNLHTLLGEPPILPGQRIYTEFTSQEVEKIYVEVMGTQGVFIKSADGWRSATVPNDRMDPRFAGLIIAFVQNLVVTDYAPESEIDRGQAGLREGNIHIELEGKGGRSLARFRMGSRTPLMSENTDTGTLSHDVYIQPRERMKRKYIYACSGDIRDIFGDGLKLLRDHRPFYVNPLQLQSIRLRTDKGELTLGRENPTEETPNPPWRIVKPLDVRTDREAVLALLEGIVQLKANKVVDRSSVTLPSTDAAGKTVQIALTPYGQEKEILLDVYPPESADATEALATVSDRPDAVFYLPLKAGEGSLANLPVTVDDLRDRALTHLNVAGIRAISISPLTGSRILLTLETPKPWQVEVNGNTQPANEQRLFSLLKALGTKAIRIETDAATDFTPWGLDKPFLVIEIIDGGNQTLRLNFGMDKSGLVYVNRQGTPTVMQVERSILSSISIMPYEWRQALAMSVTGVDLESVQRIVRDGSPLDLTYNDAMESWRGKIGDVDVTDRIDPTKAKTMLEAISGVYVSRWLAVGDPEAEAALATPVFTLTVVEKIVDDFGDDTGEKKRRTLTLAAMPDSGDYYGKLSGEPHPFVIDRTAAFRMGTDPLEKQQP